MKLNIWSVGKTMKEAREFAIENTLYVKGGNVHEAARVLEIMPKTIYNVLGVERIEDIRKASNVVKG